MKVLICGCGAIGSNLAKYLTVDLRGEHEITVIDYDIVEDRNIDPGTQFYFREQVGLQKTEALQYNIYKAYEREINVIEEKLSEENNALLMGYDLIIDCFDNYEGRHQVQMQWDFSKDGEKEVLHIGFSDQMTFAIEWADNYQVPDDITSGMDICEMPGATSFVNLVASLGSLTAQEFIRNKKKREFVGNGFSIKEMK